MSKLAKKYREYGFPMFWIWVVDQLLKKVAVIIGTLHAKFSLMMNRAVYGKKLQVDGFVRIRCPKAGRIMIGGNCMINSRFGSNLVGKTTPTILQCLGNGHIHIGNNTGISFAVISSRARISIGNNVRIGGNVRIFDHNFHSLSWQDRRNGLLDQQGIKAAPIAIGDDVFIGANALIMKGVTIGDRAIIGAAAVVTHNVPEDEIWAGNPACMVRGKR